MHEYGKVDTRVHLPNIARQVEHLALLADSGLKSLENIMTRSTSQSPLRPLALVVSSLIIVASSLLISAASFGSPTISGYGIDHGRIAQTQLAVR
jgi:hypothetical protein